MKFPESVPAKNFPNYEALCDGNIRNRKTGRILKTKNNKGYKEVSLRKDNRSHTVLVARVIADSFYNEDHSKLNICYKDCDRQNTEPDNLIFCTQQEAIIRSFEDGRREFVNRVKVRIVETDKVYRSIRACAIALGDERYRYSIADCLDNPNKTFMGYHFVKHIRRY